jgi:hypothetical protein
MFYKILAVVSDFIPLAIAVGGIIMSYKQPPEKSHLKTTLILLGVGIVGTLILSWTRIHNETLHTAEIQSQQQSIQTLQTKLDEAEIRHIGEIRYLEGEVHVFAEFAPAVVKLAEATELTARKTYEAKMLSNKDLYDATQKVVGKLREFGRNRRIQSDRQTNQQMAALQAAKTREESQKIFQENMNASMEASFQVDAEFRSTILPDAVYVRNELLRRKIPEPPVGSLHSPHEIEFIFSGILAGPSPEFDAADYLEQMAKQLPLK